MGGQFALVLSPKGFGACAPFYGTPLPRNLSETLDGACPIVASFGRRDPLGIGAADKLQKVVDDLDIPSDIKAYQGAGHSFANKLPAQPLIRIGGFGYDEAAEADAWSRVFDFFGEHLREAARIAVYSGSRSSGFSTSSMFTSLKVMTRTCLTNRAGRYMSHTQASASRSSK